VRAALDVERSEAGRAAAGVDAENACGL